MTKEHLLSWLEQGNLSIPNLLITDYKKIGLTEIELVMLLQVYSFSESGNYFPTPKELSSRMTLSEKECSELLSRLIQKGFVAIFDSSTGFEKCSLKPLYEKIIDQFLRNKAAERNLQKQTNAADLYTTFEKEFGRPLSPFECESLAIWIDDDQHSEEIIKAALREAVISGKLNFRYIDRILFNWKRNGIVTVEQAREQGRKFRQYQRQPNEQQRQDTNPNDVPFYNWLEQ